MMCSRKPEYHNGYFYAYSVDEIAEGAFTIVNETSFTGHTVLGPQGREAAVFYCDLMNEVYNQVKKDVEKGYISAKND